MSDLSRFILGITGCSLLVAVLEKFPLSGSSKALLRLLGGMVMTLMLLGPLRSFSWYEGFQMAEHLSFGMSAADSGTDLSREAMGSIIKSRTEAYILDKAMELDADLVPQVALDDSNIPISVTMTGPISPYARQRLSDILETDLGIAKEHQQWKNG